MKKKSGVVGDLISGTGGLIVGVIIVLVIVSTLLGANLLGNTTSVYYNSSVQMASNFTQGIDQVSGKIPTILLIGAVVLLFGVIVLLVRQSQAMGIGGSSGGSL